MAPARFASSIRELARALGVSHSAVIRARDDGRIAPLGDGRWDVAACRAAWQSNTKRTRPSAITAPASDEATPAASAAAPAALGPVPGVAQVEVSPEAREAIVETLRDAGHAITGEPTLRDASTALEILRGHKAKIDVDRLRGQSVDRAKAFDVLTTFMRTVRNELVAWVEHAAPTIALELGLGDHHALQVVLEAQLATKLEQLASVPPADALFGGA